MSISVVEPNVSCVVLYHQSSSMTHCKISCRNVLVRINLELLFQLLNNNIGIRDLLPIELNIRDLAFAAELHRVDVFIFYPCEQSGNLKIKQN